MQPEAPPPEQTSPINYILHPSIAYEECIRLELRVREAGGFVTRCAGTAVREMRKREYDEDDGGDGAGVEGAGEDEKRVVVLGEWITPRVGRVGRKEEDEKRFVHADELRKYLVDLGGPSSPSPLPTSTNTIAAPLTPSWGTCPDPRTVPRFLEGLPIHVHHYHDTHVYPPIPPTDTDTEPLLKRCLKAAGAVLTTTEHEAEVLVSSTLTDAVLREARKGKVCGTVGWLREVLREARLEDPRLRAVHVPRPVGSGPLRGVAVSLTGFTTNGIRSYVLSSLSATGATYARLYTPRPPSSSHSSSSSSPSPSTVLICASASGAKYAAAVKRGSPIADAQWPERCLAAWSRADLETEDALEDCVARVGTVGSVVKPVNRGCQVRSPSSSPPQGRRVASTRGSARRSRRTAMDDEKFEKWFSATFEGMDETLISTIRRANRIGNVNDGTYRPGEDDGEIPVVIGGHAGSEYGDDTADEE